MRANTEVIGAIVVEIGVDALTDIVTAGQDWDLLGLGDTGDAYIVGADGRFAPCRSLVRRRRRLRRPVSPGVR